MNWRSPQYYYDPYKQQKNSFRNKSPQNYQNRDQRSYSNERKIGHIIITSNSKDKKKIFQIKSLSKQKQSNEEKPKMFIINNNYFADKKDQNRAPSSSLQYRNKKLQIIPENQNLPTSYRKSPIKIIKKSPAKIDRIEVPIVKTTVTAPSSISSSVLNNFQSNPDRLLENMSQSKLSRIFKK